MTIRWLCIVLFLCFSSGCATTQGTFGDHVRYSPAFRGYVLAHHNGSDDPDIDDAILILRDPLTGAKLRCEEQVADWRETFEDVAADQVTDNNAAIVAVVAASFATAPTIAMQPLGAASMLEQGLVAGALYDAMSSEDAGELLSHGVAQYKRHRYAHAITFLERALAKDSAVGVWERAYYFLGMAYAELGREERARIALWQFITRAGVRDVNAYREAEGLLRDLGEAPAPCQSVEPVTMYW